MYVVVNKSCHFSREVEGDHPVAFHKRFSQTYATLEDAADLQAEMCAIHGHTIDSCPIYKLEQVDPLEGRLALARANKRRKENE